jgi:ketosteroid isomerase-like protein
MSAANQALIRRLFEEVINGGDLVVFDALYARNCVDRNAFRGHARGPAAKWHAISEIRAAFPDLHVTIESLRTEADTVITRETWRGTHAFTGKQVTGTVTHIFRIHDGQIVEEWSGGWAWLDQLYDEQTSRA